MSTPVLERTQREALFDSILQSLARMPALQRRVFELGHYEGLNIDEISRKTGLSRAEVETLLHRANHEFSSNLARQHKCCRQNSAGKS